MNYEVFRRSVSSRSETPVFSIGREGRIYLNAAISKVLREGDVKHVIFAFDRDDRKIGVAPATDANDAAALHRIRTDQYHSAGMINAKAFLDSIGFDYSERRHFHVQINKHKAWWIEIPIPDELLKKSRRARASR